MQPQHKVKSIKRRLLIISAFAVMLALLIGLDELIINSTINRPDLECNTHADCSRNYYGQGRAPKYGCVNVRWNYYESIVKRVFADKYVDMSFCACEQNRCTKQQREDVTDPDVCANAEVFRNQCYFNLALNVHEEKYCDSIGIEERAMRELCREKLASR